MMHYICQIKCLEEPDQTFRISISLDIVLTNSRRVADKKEGVGTYCFILWWGFSHCLVPDKAIAHTNGYVWTHYGLYKPMMWCHCLLSSVLRNFARISSKKIISITPFCSKCPSLPLLDRNCDKVSKKMWMCISFRFLFSVMAGRFSRSLCIRENFSKNLPSQKSECQTVISL